MEQTPEYPAIEVLPLYRQDPPPPPSDPSPEPKMRRHPGRIILGIIAMTLIVSIIVGSVTNWFGWYGPGGKLMLAIYNTFSSNSFTVQFDASVGNFDFDTVTLKAIIDIQDRSLTAVLLDKYRDISLAIYDGYLIEATGSRYKVTDIQDHLDRFFDSFEDIKNVDLITLLNDLDPELYEKITETIDPNRLDGCLISLYRQFNDRSWLEDTAGLSIKKEDGITGYVFDPDLPALSSTSLSCFHPAFLHEEDYQTLYSSLVSCEEELDALDCEMTFGVRRDHLTSLDLKAMVNDKAVRLSFSFLDLDSTHIDEDTLDQIVSFSNDA